MGPLSRWHQLQLAHPLAKSELSEVSGMLFRVYEAQSGSAMAAGEGEAGAGPELPALTCPSALQTPSPWSSNTEPLSHATMPTV